MSATGQSGGAAGDALLRIEDLTIGFGDADDGAIVHGLTLSVGRGEVLALVGESGSGKTMACRAVLGLLPTGGHVRSGRVLFAGTDLCGASPEQMQHVRGREIGMVFQEPMTSLNPAFPVGFQLTEGLRHHYQLPQHECRRRAIDMLGRMGVPDAAGCLDRYPHEFSGGLRQRMLIASVFLLRPSLLIADEPTTALDVLIQKQVFELMLEVARELGTAVVVITHDLAVVARYVDRVAVMYRGRLTEQGAIRDILLRPQHPYTRALLGALPARDDRAAAAGTATLDALIEVKDLVVEYAGRRTWPWRRPSRLKAVRDVDLAIRRGETLAVVGESGSGKTTLARTLLKLVTPNSGVVRFDGQDIAGLAGEPLRRFRSRLQIVFQDPYSALDPRMRIAAIVAEGLRHAKELTRAEKRARVQELLESVGLGAGYAERFPHELSGGQRQRVNIARALISRPEFVVADEPVSALDVLVQAEILAVLKRLQGTHGFTCLFISHDLGVVEQIADRVIVMYRGRIVEEGRRDQVFDSPAHPYTCQLLAAAPRLVGDSSGGYQLVDYPVEPPRPPAGYDHEGWDRGEPRSDRAWVYAEVAPGHRVACLAR